MDDSIERRLRDIIDRQEIVECLLRYCRGVDRMDRDLMLSAYHPDAIDDHGLVVMGRKEFVDWALAYHREYQHSTQHAISNVTVEFDGYSAHVESYFTFWADNREKPNQLAYGRYVDRFDKRDGRWAIAARVCITEAVFQVDDFPLTPEGRALLRSNGMPRRDRLDVSYERPLTVPRRRLT
jgi:hypothetical protein